MRLRRFTSYLLGHYWQTLTLIFLVTFIPVLGILGIIIAAMVTLCVGAKKGSFLTVAATLPFIISFYFSVDVHATIPIVIWAAIGVAVISNILTYVFAIMLYRQASWSTILQFATLLGVLVISIIHLAYPSIADWWGTQLQFYYNHAKLLASNAQTGLNLSSDEAQIETINITKQYATGLMTTAILFNALLQLVVARWWQAIVFKPGGLRYELHRIRLSQLAGVLFILSIVLSYLGNSVVLDIMPILYTLLGVVGLSIVHYFFGYMKSKTAWFWLAILYLILLFSLPTSLILLAIFALFDIWIDLRKRFINLHKN